MSTDQILVDGIVATGEYEDGLPIYSLAYFDLRCSKCNSENVARMGWRSLRVSDMPIQEGNPTSYVVKRPRLRCNECNEVETVTYPAAALGGHTGRLCDFAWRMFCAHGTAGAVERTGLTRGVIRRVIERQEELLCRRLAPILPKSVAVVYLTLAAQDAVLLVDVETGRCVETCLRKGDASVAEWISELPGSESLKRLFLPLHANAARFESAMPSAKILVEINSFIAPVKSKIVQSVIDLVHSHQKANQILLEEFPDLTGLLQTDVVQLQGLRQAYDAVSRVRTEASFDRFTATAESLRIGSVIRRELNSANSNRENIVAGLRFAGSTPYAEDLPATPKGKPPLFARLRSLALSGGSDGEPMDVWDFYSTISS